MALITQPWGTLGSAITVTGLGTLANNTYVASAAQDFTALTPANPDEVAVEVSVGVGTLSGTNTGVYVFLKTSFDNSTFSSGPESGTSDTDQPQLERLAFIPATTSTQTLVKHIPIKEVLGYVPKYGKFVFLNKTGAALTSASVKLVARSGNV